jgi:hypothetical protein
MSGSAMGAVVLGTVSDNAGAETDSEVVGPETDGSGLG